MFLSNFSSFFKFLLLSFGKQAMVLATILNATSSPFQGTHSNTSITQLARHKQVRKISRLKGCAPSDIMTF
jgi:hypothetical protein